MLFAGKCLARVAVDRQKESGGFANRWWGVSNLSPGTNKIKNLARKSDLSAHQ
jgi:hypothetical protein